MYEYDKLLAYRKRDSVTETLESYIRSLVDVYKIGEDIRLGVLSCFKDREDTIIVELFGEAEVMGKWEKYLRIFADLIEAIRSNFKDIWLIYLENDPANEYFYAYLGIHK